MREGRRFLIAADDVNEEFESLMAIESLTRTGSSSSSSACGGGEIDSGEYHVDKRDDVREKACG